MSTPKTIHSESERESLRVAEADGFHDGIKWIGEARRLGLPLIIRRTHQPEAQRIRVNEIKVGARRRLRVGKNAETPVGEGAIPTVKEAVDFRR